MGKIQKTIFKGTIFAYNSPKLLGLIASPPILGSYGPVMFLGVAKVINYLLYKRSDKRDTDNYIKDHLFQDEKR